MNQPAGKNIQGQVEVSWLTPKHLEWHLGSWVSHKNQSINAQTRRSYMPGMSTMYVSTDDLQRRVRESLQPNVHRIVAEYFANEKPVKDLRFVDADPGDGELASALSKQFGDMQVVAMKKGMEKHRLDTHLPPNAKHVSQNILEYVNFANRKEFTPDCIHLGHLPSDARHTARILQWSIEHVADDGMVLVTLDDEGGKDFATQTGWREQCGIGPSGNIAGIESWAKGQKVGMESCVVSVETLLDNSADGVLALHELLYSELPVDKRIKADAQLAKYVEKLRSGGGVFRHNTRLIALFADAGMIAERGRAQVSSRIDAVSATAQISAKSAITAAKPVDTFEDTFKRWWAQINNKHERHFKQMTRDWKAGDAVKKTEMEAAVRAELKECGIAKADMEQYFQAVMAHFGAVGTVAAPTPEPPAPVSAPAASVAPVEKEVTPAPLPLRTSTVAQVLERMELISEHVKGNESGPEFEKLLQQSGWAADVWRLLHNEAGKLATADQSANALDVLNRRGTRSPTSAQARPKPTSPERPAAAGSPPVRRFSLNEPMSPAEAARIQSIPAVTLPGLRSGAIPSTKLADVPVQTAPGAEPAATPHTAGPVAALQGAVSSPELDEIGLAKMPAAARAKVQALAQAYRELRGEGHHHLTPEELEAAGKLVYALREYGYGFTDVAALIHLSNPLQQRAMETTDALSEAETVAFESLRNELTNLLPKKGADRVDLRGVTRSKFAAFLRLWRKLHGTYTSLADAVPFAIPSPAALAILNGEFRNELTRDLAPDAFPEEPEEVEASALVPVPANAPAPIPVPAADVPANDAAPLPPQVPLSTNVDIPENIRTQVEEMMQSSLQRIPVAHRDSVQRNFALLLARPRTKEATPEYVRRAIVELVPILQEYGYTKGMLMSVIKMASITMDKMLEGATFLSEAEQVALRKTEETLLAVMPAKDEAQHVHCPEAARSLLATYVRLQRKQGKKLTDMVEEAGFALPLGHTLSIIESGFVGKTTAEISPGLFDEKEETNADVPSPVEPLLPIADAPAAEPENASDNESAEPAEVPAVVPNVESEQQPVSPVRSENVAAAALTERMAAPAKPAEAPAVSVEDLQRLVEKQRGQIESLMAQVQALQQAPKVAAAPDVQKTRVVINHPNGTQSVLTIEGNAPAVLFLPPETEARGTLKQ